MTRRARAAPRATALVLCGGASSRMGRGKEGLPFGRGTLLARAVRIAREACDEVVVVAAPRRRVPPLPRGTRVVRDAAPGRLGPLAGLAAGLAAARAAVAVVVPCDAPLLRAELLAALLAAAARPGGPGAAIPVVRGMTEPLPSAYLVARAGLAAELVARGERRLDALAVALGATRLVEAEVRRADPSLDSFRDADTPEEYAALCRAAGVPAPAVRRPRRGRPRPERRRRRRRT